jgi:uncharacterized protein (TIGR01319 family)
MYENLWLERNFEGYRLCKFLKEERCSMSSFYMLIDFGSTYTKVSIIDIDQEILIGKAQDYTTVEQDVNIGFENALKKLDKQLIKDGKINKTLACSSAAGGLKMVVIGLVPELTVEAAKRASLSAGAIVVGTYSFELVQKDIVSIENLKPDIILLSGGTDGGDKNNILHNSKVLSSSKLNVPIIVAGNKVVSEKVYKILKNAGKMVKITDNVMPRLDQLEVTKANELIREIFSSHITKAKGIQQTKKFLDDIILPTPSSVLTSATLLARGTADEPGIGEIIVVDVGGATTDVHSVSRGEPSKEGVVWKGLSEPYIKRTVEGDLGIRYNASNILEQAGMQYFLKETELPECIIKKRIIKIVKDIKEISIKNEDKSIDKTLAKFAVKLAMERHSGFIKTMYTPNGETLVQYGKDLSNVTKIIGCGGIFCYTNDPVEIFHSVLFDSEKPWSLKPKQAKFFIDKEYIMAHAGLIAEKFPTKALRILKKYLLQI